MLSLPAILGAIQLGTKVVKQVVSIYADDEGNISIVEYSGETSDMDAEVKSNAQAFVEYLKAQKAAKARGETQTPARAPVARSGPR